MIVAYIKNKFKLYVRSLLLEILSDESKDTSMTMLIPKVKRNIQLRESDTSSLHINVEYAEKLIHFLTTIDSLESISISVDFRSELDTWYNTENLASSDIYKCESLCEFYDNLLKLEEIVMNHGIISKFYRPIIKVTGKCNNNREDGILFLFEFDDYKSQLEIKHFPKVIQGLRQLLLDNIPEQLV